MVTSEFVVSQAEVGVVWESHLRLASEVEVVLRDRALNLWGLS